MGLLRFARSDRAGRWGTAFTLWYLRAAAGADLLGGVWAPFGRGVRRHDAEQLYTPYLLAAGFTSGLFAAFLAVTIRRGKRAAWVLNVLLCGAVVAGLGCALASPQAGRHRQNWASLALSALFLAALLAGRRSFRGRGEPADAGRAAGLALAGTAVCVAVGTALVTATGGGTGTALGDRARYTLSRVVSLSSDPGPPTRVHAPGWVGVVVGVLSAALFALVLYVAFRAPRGRGALSAGDEAALRELLERHGGRDSLGYFALRRDKRVIFSATAKAAIAYRVVGGVTLASGDPIGDPEAWPGAIERWLAQAGEHGWTPAVVGASEEAGVVYARHGLDALEIGDEAVVDTAAFRLDGRSMRTVRQAHNRLRQRGYTVRLRRHREIPAAQMAALLERARRWRGARGERGFSMALGRLGDGCDGACVMAECLDPAGVPRALLSFVPWGADGLSLDLMRREGGGDNGLVEFTVIEVVQRSAGLGVRRVSLNFALFRSVFDRASRLGAGPALRVWRSLLAFCSRWWRIESRYRANAKYRPAWTPRYLLFRSAGELPRVGLAGARAEGFLTVPRLPGALGRRRRPAVPAERAAAPSGGPRPGTRGPAAPGAAPGRVRIIPTERSGRRLTSDMGDGRAVAAWGKLRRRGLRRPSR
ncbi:phosphatidylglycerol lysyltransferase domain-containing protein [Streptomyces sp. SL13]|uniref:Phosphatidylglycerol lysyltransferase domain-containing protein n=1 Tax=Streptantibioticus silvisoli TaxID=2705255 RepID=A0AA90K8K5_9ACTN|nr:phosphatidylglycerol lysyltransferase domain-containing protein [Streptantibioticus silvisoli]MDI5970168.1 phosphatidylglycerol lysyltransferase domain-containing protein [Streptantibioticus silvisoli]